MCYKLLVIILVSSISSKIYAEYLIIIYNNNI